MALPATRQWHFVKRDKVIPGSDTGLGVRFASQKLKADDTQAVISDIKAAEILLSDLRKNKIKNLEALKLFLKSATIHNWGVGVGGGTILSADRP